MRLQYDSFSEAYSIGRENKKCHISLKHNDVYRQLSSPEASQLWVALGQRVCSGGGPARRSLPFIKKGTVYTSI